MSTGTPTWDDVVLFAEVEIEKASCALETPRTDYAESEALRARILALRELIDLPNRKGPPEVPQVPNY